MRTLEDGGSKVKFSGLEVKKEEDSGCRLFVMFTGLKQSAAAKLNQVKNNIFKICR